MNLHRQRVVLTMVWFAGMMSSSAVALSYMHARDGFGVPLLLWADTMPLLQSVLTIYAIYLGGIIAFWFAKPFKVKADKSLEQIRFWIALAGTVILNAAYVAGLSIGYWDDAARLDDIIGSRQIIGWLSFIVAPPNLYFFGLKHAAQAP